MPDLEATTDPTALVPGDPAGLHEIAWSLQVTADALHEAGDGLARLSTPTGWTGAAADEFRSAFALQPERWRDAARAHQQAADAVERHAVTLARAQQQAGDAAQASTDPAATPDDPRRAASLHLLEDARTRVRTSGDEAAAAVAAARDRAPTGTAVSPAATSSVPARLGNAGASLGNAVLSHPGDAFGVAAGAGLVSVSAAGLVGSVALDTTGVGALGGVPLGGLSAAGVAAGVGMAGAGVIDLALHGATDDRVAPFQVNTGAEPEAEVPAAPPFEPPTAITGMTRHGQQQAQGRDGGVGVSDEAMADAVANPVVPPDYQANGTYRYKGRDAWLSLNEGGEVVTTWAKTRNGWRNR